MKRKRTRRPEPDRVDAILTADWHIRADVPECRTDDYLEAQWNKVSQIFSLAQQYDCPIIVAGDLGHRAHWPNWLLAWFLRVLARSGSPLVYAVYGQHDLPAHSWEDRERSALAVLEAAGAVCVVGGDPETYATSAPLSSALESLESMGPSYQSEFTIFGASWGCKVPSPHHPDLEFLGRKILVTHRLVLQDSPLYPGQKDPLYGYELLERYSEYDLIVTGDNHQSFVERTDDGRLLVNPGSLMRMRSDQVDHRPRVYLWDAEKNEVYPEYLTIREGVIKQTTEQGTDGRFDAYVQQLGEGFEGTPVSFQDRLRVWLDEVGASGSLRQWVWRCVFPEEVENGDA